MKEFTFGVATAATQIEGGAFQDGKGESVWDYYSKNNAIIYGQDCYTACDSYNRVEEDLRLIKELGVDSYRFSLSWTRIQPLGYGEVNAKGLAYYDRLIDGLLAMGVKPLVTLFHWDLPMALHKKGGFLNRDIVDRFQEYAKIVAEHFSDKEDIMTVTKFPVNEKTVKRYCSPTVEVRLLVYEDVLTTSSEKTQEDFEHVDVNAMFNS